MKGLVTLICGCAFAITMGIGSAIAQGPTNPDDPGIKEKLLKAQAAAKASESVLNNCFVKGVAAFADRVHILCTGQQLPKGPIGSPVYSALQSGAVRYFAVENSVAANAMALTVMSAANVAVQKNTSLTIIYLTDPKHNPAGCHFSDCRRIVGVITN